MLQKFGWKNMLFSALVGILFLGAGIFVAELDRSISVDAGIGDVAYEVDGSVPVGQIYLEVSGLQEEQKLKLLVNGTPGMDLDTPQKTVDIPNSCVLEVDSREVDGPVTISITGKSSGVVSDCVGRCVTVEDGIANLGTFVVTGNRVQK